MGRCNLWRRSEKAGDQVGAYSQDDYRWMAEALSLAERGQGHVEPNPMVGCVLVREGRKIGQGFHTRFGAAHAEVEALASCADAQGATAYVSLEPCCHHGKTPPCSQALIAAGVGKVIVAMQDPFGHVDGGGIAELRDAGLEVQTGLLKPQALQLNAPYLRRLRSGRPWVIAKWAMSLDGKIATASGESQWISNSHSRAESHRLRGRVDAILIGIGSVLADDPLLTARPAGPRQATRIVFDSQARIPPTSQLCRTARDAPLLLVCGEGADAQRVNALRDLGCGVFQGDQDADSRLTQLLEHLGKSQMTNVMLEGGAALLGGFWRQGLIDEAHVYVAPMLIGGQEAPSPLGGEGALLLGDAMRFESLECFESQGDLRLVARVAPPE